MNMRATLHRMLPEKQDLVSRLVRRSRATARRSRATARQLVPNVGTVVVVALLLFASQVGADPSAPAVSTPAPASPEAVAESVVKPREESTNITISYQGRLADNAGVPIDQTVNLTFRLYDVSTGGIPLWVETHWAVPVRSGVFQVLLGSQQLLSTSLFYQHDSLYLGLSVGGGGEMAPRQPVAAVPYARVAETLRPNAVTAGNLVVGGMLTVNGTDLELRGRSSGGTGNAGRALVDGGPGHGLFINYGNDFGKVQILGDTSVAGELRYNAWRQDHTENTMKTNVRIQTGWSYLRGNKDTNEVSKTVTFPSSFSEPPIVLVTSVGLSTSRPGTIDDFFGTVAREVVHATDIQADRFKVIYARADQSKFTNEYYFGFSWIAIGR